MSPLSNPAAAVPLSVAIKTESRAMDAASGDVAYTGYGFQPRALIVFQVQSTTKLAGWGMGDNSLVVRALANNKTSDAFTFDNSVIYLIEDTGKDQKAIIKSFDANGFTLTWTRTGATASATAYLMVMALR